MEFWIKKTQYNRFQRGQLAKNRFKTKWSKFKQNGDLSILLLLHIEMQKTNL
jgi:hypothetical protein